MDFYRNPFFWALLSMLGMVGATSLFSVHRFRRNGVFVSLVLVLVTLGRVVLVLPFCTQPRLDMAGWHLAAGAAVLAAAFAVAAGPLVVVRWWSPPTEGMQLRTTGVYALVRHPIYLAEILWSLGWAILFRSTYGVALTPAWWSAFLIHALSEEAEMERVLGPAYEEYKKKVRGRIFPGLPV